MKKTIIKMRSTNTTDIQRLAWAFRTEINAELVSENQRNVGEVTVILLSFEKYYWRNGSYASLSVMLTESESQQTADIIGYGGGEGLLNISLGANSNFAKMAADILQQFGFKEESNTAS